MDTESAVFRYIRNLILYFMKKTLLIVILPAAGSNEPDALSGQSVYKIKYPGRQTLLAAVQKRAVQVALLSVLS